MEIDGTRAGLYVGFGALTGISFTAVRHGFNPKALALGAATGILAGAAQAGVEQLSGSGGKGMAASTAVGALVGAALLGRVSTTGAAASYGKATVIGAAAGLLGPIAAGMVLAQVQPA